MSKRVSPRGKERTDGSKPWLLPAGVGLVLGAAAGWGIGHFAGAADAAPPRPAASSALSSVPSPAQRTQIDAFVREYFTSWSRRDIDAYGRCFHPNARIWFGTGSSMALPEFLASQRQAHAQSPVPLTEDPLTWDCQVNNGLAHVRVHWELHRGSQNIRGYDFFTLAFSEGRWQIVALVFNEE